MRIQIQNRYFEFSESALQELNELLTSIRVTPLKEKYNSQTESYDYIPADPVTLEVETTSRWKAVKPVTA